jgi:hypothetical protein
MNPHLTPEQQREFENAEKIGDIFSDVVATQTTNLLPIRVNPLTVKEAAGYFQSIGAKKPFLQSNEQFVMNCIVYSGSIFASCAPRLIICQNPYKEDLRLWYGNGNPKDHQPFGDVKYFRGENSLMYVVVFIDAVYDRIAHLLKPHFTPQSVQPAKPQTIYADFLEIATPLVINSYRRIAAERGCAPGLNVSDAKIIEIYKQVGGAFQTAAHAQGAHIAAAILNNIFFYFFQTYQLVGDAMFQSHLEYEVEKYSKYGLRDEYKKPLKLF